MAHLPLCQTPNDLGHDSLFAPPCRWLGDKIRVRKDRHLWLVEHFVDGLDREPVKYISTDGSTATRKAHSLFSEQLLADERKLKDVGRVHVLEASTSSNTSKPKWLDYLRDRFLVHGILEVLHRL